MMQYSFSNRERLLTQLPTASDVRSRSEWNQAGRLIRKGEKALRIVAPVRYEQKGGSKVPTHFKQVPVFDISQTVPMEVSVETATSIAS